MPVTAGNEGFDLTPYMTGVTDLITPDTGTFAGNTSFTTETDDLLHYSKTKVIRYIGVGFGASVSQSFGTPLDLTNKSIALINKIFAPDQVTYWTGTLTADFTAGISTSFTLTSSTYTSASNGLRVTVQMPGGVILNAIYTHSTITFSSIVIVAGSGSTVTSGTRVYTCNGAVQPSASLTIQFALSSADIANRLEVRPLTGGWASWSTIIGVLGDVDSGVGPETRSVGSPVSDLLTRVGYIKVTIGATSNLTTLPRTDYDGTNDYRGPQMFPSTNQFEWKFDSLVSFTRTKKRAVCLSFDDGTASHASIADNELCKPRPGFPNGGRASFTIIYEHFDLFSGDPTLLSRQAGQRMAANGEEISLHSDRKGHHQGEDSGSQGPLPRWEAAGAGNARTELQTEIAHLKGDGIVQPWYSHAMPLSAGCCSFVPYMPTDGIVCSRTLSGGGATTVVTNGATPNAAVTGITKGSGFTRRFLEYPMGDRGKIPAVPMSSHLATINGGGTYTFTQGSTTVTTTATNATASHIGSYIYNTANLAFGTKIANVVGTTITLDTPATATGTAGSSAITIGDGKGHLEAMQYVREACRQGLCASFYSHVQTEYIPNTAAWGRSQWQEFLNFCSDLKTGSNTYGNNPTLESYSDLEIVPLTQFIRQTPLQRVNIEQCGVGI